MFCIYAHINKENKKVYVGFTKNVNDLQRRWDYGSGYTRKGNTKFSYAIKKYGWKNFEHTILETGLETLEQAKEREKYWISYYDSFNHGYNMTLGGDSGCFDRDVGKSAKKIICIETKEIFPSMRNCAKCINYNYKTFRQTILKCPWRKIKGQHYMLLEDYEKGKIIKSPKKQFPVMCIETKEIFENSRVAERKLNLKIDSVYKCCRGIRVSSGHLHWQFVDEELRKRNPPKPHKEVICLETQQTFYDIRTASFQTKIASWKILWCCENKKKYIVFNNKIYHFAYL